MSTPRDGISHLPAWPVTAAGRVILLLGAAGLVVGLYYHLPMVWVELGYGDYSAGGGEALVAMFFGLPVIGVTALVFGAAEFRRQWRSRATRIGFYLALGVLGLWFLACLATLFLASPVLA